MAERAVATAVVVQQRECSSCGISYPSAVEQERSCANGRVSLAEEVQRKRSSAQRGAEAGISVERERIPANRCVCRAGGQAKEAFCPSAVLNPG